MKTYGKKVGSTHHNETGTKKAGQKTHLQGQLLQSCHLAQWCQVQERIVCAGINLQHHAHTRCEQADIVVADSHAARGSASRGRLCSRQLGRQGRPLRAPTTHRTHAAGKHAQTQHAAPDLPDSTPTRAMQPLPTTCREVSCVSTAISPTCFCAMHSFSTVSPLSAAGGRSSSCFNTVSAC
jgi:hypothetical protein